MRVSVCLCLILAAVGASARPVPPPTSPLGLGFVAASDACPATCAAQGKRAATFHPFRDTNRVAGAPALAPAAVCSAVRSDGTRASGWQALDGPAAVCNIVDGASAVASSAFACLCLGEGEVQGLERARGGPGGCASACGASITGAPGRSIAVGSGDHACLALSEQGLGNRFGTEVAGGACLTARGGGVALASDSYSCVCAFKEGARSLPAPAAKPAVEAAPAAAADPPAAVQPTVETQSIATAAAP